MAAPQDGAFENLLYRYDAINVNEAMNYLFKKAIGRPNTLPQGSLYGEIPDSYNSFPFININKIYNQSIPQSNLPFNNYILDPTFSNVNFKFPSSAIVVTNDLQSQRYYSSNYPHIAYYSNLLLSKVADDPGINEEAYTSTETVSYGHPLLVNAIPITLVPYTNGAAGSYSMSGLTSNIGAQTVISPTNGYWLVDTDSGILTVYDQFRGLQLGPILDSTGATTGEYRLPRISFYRYEGLIGSTNVANTQDF